MFCLRLALVFLAVWLVLVSGNLEESQESNQTDQLEKKLLQERRALCQKGPSFGYCKGNRKIWSFNFRPRECTSFTFSKCGGSGNRFHSYEECMDFCSEKNWNSPDMDKIV